MKLRNSRTRTKKYSAIKLFISGFSFHQFYHMQWRLSHFLFWFHGRNNSHDLWNNCIRYSRLARILAHCSLFPYKIQFVCYQRKVQLNKPKKSLIVPVHWKRFIGNEYLQHQYYWDQSSRWTHHSRYQHQNKGYSVCNPWNLLESSLKQGSQGPLNHSLW